MFKIFGSKCLTFKRVSLDLFSSILISYLYPQITSSPLVLFTHIFCRHARSRDIMFVFDLNMNIMMVNRLFVAIEVSVYNVLWTWWTHTCNCTCMLSSCCIMNIVYKYLSRQILDLECMYIEVSWKFHWIFLLHCCNQFINLLKKIQQSLRSKPS